MLILITNEHTLMNNNYPLTNKWALKMLKTNHMYEPE